MIGMSHCGLRDDRGYILRLDGECFRSVEALF